MTHKDEFLTAEQVAEMLGVAPSTMMTWRARKMGPPFVRLGHRTVRYRLSDVQAWVAERADG